MGGSGAGGQADGAVDIAGGGGTGAGPPLEALVEAETPAVLPLRVRTQTGLHLVRLLRAAGLSAVADACIAAFAVSGPAPGADGGSSGAAEEDPVGSARARLAAGRVPDGSTALAAIAALTDASGAVTDLPAELAAAAGPDRAAAEQVLTAWLRWSQDFLVASSGTAPDTASGTRTGASWNPHRLEHTFAVSGRLSSGEAVLAVDEYTGGTLDWFHGDLSDAPSLGEPTSGPVPPTPLRDTTIPTPVRFAGMPSDRLFAFEDAAVYVGGVEAGRTDLARLAVVEFALAYSVDWFLVPLVLPYGTVTRFDTVRVVDTFGVEVEVGPAREATRPGWTAFQSTPVTDTSRRGDMFVLAPTVARVLAGEPLEEVALFRDEMANLVWGVERVAPHPRTGEPVPRSRLASRVSLRQSLPDDLDDAEIVYRLMTPVPENWMPLVAVRDRPADPQARHVLERRPMLRYLPDGTAELVNPVGTVLLSRPDADPATDRLRIAEEEVPRDGTVVTRTFQMARSEGGGTVLWVGRRVRTGAGEGASGLRFDTALPPGGV